MPSTRGSKWDDLTVHLQRQIALEAFYRSGGKTSKVKLAAAINAVPEAIVRINGEPGPVSGDTARNRVKEAIADLDVDGDLPKLRAEFAAQLRFALGKVMARIENIDNLDPSSELSGAIRALLDVQRELAEHYGLHRLAPPPITEIEEMDDSEMVRLVLESISPVDLALMAPDQVADASAELERLRTLG